MTTPVSNANSSYYDPNAQFSPADEPAASSAATGPSPAAPPPLQISVPPVVITGDAGAQQLVKQHDAQRAPDCSLEGKNAALSCSKAGIAAAAGALLSTTVVGAALGAAATFAEAISCGKDLRTFYDCKTQ